MSNESSQPTQFQQRAELRLQEMELEWRRTLFERFRTICREEMMDVMHALVSNTKATNSEELEAKLREINQHAQAQHSEMINAMAELKQSALSNQAELAATNVRTAEELRSLTLKLEQPPATDPQVIETLSKGQQAISKEIASMQEETTKTLQEDMRRSTQASGTQVKKSVMIAALLSILLCLGAAAALYFLGGAALVNSKDLKAHDQMISRKSALTAEITVLQDQKTAIQKEIDALKSQRQAAETETRQAAASQASLAASLSTLQQNISRLQELQEQFRFKLVKGERGGVFVEIPPEAKPFNFMERTFIQVK